VTAAESPAEVCLAVAWQPEKNFGEKSQMVSCVAKAFDAESHAESQFVVAKLVEVVN
jgi:hypothetical protein